jgi:short-subunit dehydrogenase
MAAKLKPLEEQVVVITGASSGIGLATAEAAAKQGAKLVLAARSETALNDIVARITAAGGTAVSVACDVSDRAQVDRLAATAVQRFGRIDTWVNNAGLGLYGRLDEVTEADSRRLFDINFWGVVNGSLAALPHLKKNGGALINVGSEVSEAYVPLLGMYTATKHVVKGFTDALRVEIEDVDRAPVAITLIQPTAVDTPFPQHARNYMSQEPKLPSSPIEPARVAEAILDAAANPTREKRVGFMAKVNTTVATLAPGLADRMAAGQVGKMQYAEPPRHPEGALNQPSEATGVAGRTHGTGGNESE